jgi:hypothetical protein
MPLDAAIGQVFATRCPGGCHGPLFWLEKLCCGIVKLFSEDNPQKAQNKSFTQLIKATSYVERSNAIIGPEELSIFLAIKRKKWTEIGEIIKLQ